MYVHCTTEEGDRVVENIGCVIIVIIKFVDQDIIEFLSCFFIHTSTRGILQRYVCMYTYIYIHTCMHIYNIFYSCILIMDTFITSVKNFRLKTANFMHK